MKLVLEKRQKYRCSIQFCQQALWYKTQLFCISLAFK